ncbi:hypothetical protein CDD83_3885 [Cordyceps sp. RAO-2017]|nr:hypothetical protein CDD83_3885 [Cordyceps sp. RAO-2017]
MKVVKADDGTHGTVIGQVFANGPLLEIFYSPRGDIVAGISQPHTEIQDIKHIGHVRLRSEFQYEISYTKNRLSVTVNKRTTHFDTSQWGSPMSYFKLGNYNQAKSRTSSEVHIGAIKLIHG